MSWLAIDAPVSRRALRAAVEALIPKPCLRADSPWAPAGKAKRPAKRRAF